MITLDSSIVSYCKWQSEHNFFVMYIEPSAPSGVNITALYNLESEFSGIEVEWKQVVSYVKPSCV